MTQITPLSSRLFTLFTSALVWPLRVAEHRRVLKDLSNFNDHELADIGLSRQDLRDVTALPLSVDPTGLLAARALARADAALRTSSPSTPPAKAAARPEPFRVAAE